MYLISLVADLHFGSVGSEDVSAASLFAQRDFFSRCWNSSSCGGLDIMNTWRRENLNFCTCRVCYYRLSEPRLRYEVGIVSPGPATAGAPCGSR